MLAAHALESSSQPDRTMSAVAQLRDFPPVIRSMAPQLHSEAGPRVFWELSIAINIVGFDGLRICVAR
jgi:hypothetical protein